MNFQNCLGTAFGKSTMRNNPDPIRYHVIETGIFLIKSRFWDMSWLLMNYNNNFLLANFDKRSRRSNDLILTGTTYWILVNRCFQISKILGRPKLWPLNNIHTKELIFKKRISLRITTIKRGGVLSLFVFSSARYSMDGNPWHPCSKGKFLGVVDIDPYTIGNSDIFEHNRFRWVTLT